VVRWSGTEEVREEAKPAEVGFWQRQGRDEEAREHGRRPEKDGKWREEKEECC